MHVLARHPLITEAVPDQPLPPPWSYAQYREPRFLPFKKYLVTKFYFFSTLFNLPSYPAPISAVFSAKNTLHRLILSLSCIMTGASHSSLERWAILSEIRERRYT